MIVIVMGVSGVGKTAIGSRLANALGWLFIDADEHHPPHNVAKMAGGTPLTDEDRWPWLERLNALLRETQAREESAVLACSALRSEYRRRLTADLIEHRIVFLHADAALIRARLRTRRHRYMPASLLDSQLAALEPPSHAIAIDVSADIADCVASIGAALSGDAAPERGAPSHR
jgi:gluconokinase